MELLLNEVEEHQKLQLGDIVSIKRNKCTLNYIVSKVNGSYLLIDMEGKITKFYIDRFSSCDELWTAISKISDWEVVIYKKSDYNLKLVKKTN